MRPLCYPVAMSSWMLAVLLKPLAAFVLAAGILLPARYAVIKWVPEGRIKSILLFRIHNSDCRGR